MLTVYVSIGNSDDKLSQQEWSRFVGEVDRIVRVAAARVHGAWLSPSAAPFQNACWCFEVTLTTARRLRVELVAVGGRYRQDSVAWAVAETDLLSHH